MSDDRYTFEKRLALKIIIENENGEVLLVREPVTNEWMPGRWGLPGGKPLIKETLIETYKRKLKEESGLETEPQGLYRIEELLFDDRSVYMFHLVTRTGHDVKLSIGSEYRWVNKEMVESMKIDEFTEYFNQELLLEYLGGKKETYPITIVNTWKFYQMSSEDNFNRWLNVK